MTGLLITVTTAIISWFSYKQSSDMLMKEFEIRADIIAKSFAYQAYEGVIVQDSYMLNNVCEGVMNEKNMHYAMIYDQKMRLLYKLHASSADLESNKKLNAPSKLMRKRILSVQHGAQADKLLDVWQPIKDRTKSGEAIDIGHARIGISLSDIIALKKKLILNSVITFLIILSVGLGASFLFANRLSRSLYQLIEAMRNIILHHDLSEQIEQRSKIAETDNIQFYFNKMTEELRSSQESLQESEEKFRSISNSAQDAIIMLDKEGNISYWNKAAENIFGYAAEDVFGRDGYKVLAPGRYYESYKNAFNEFIYSGKEKDIGNRTELTARRKDGTEFPIEMSFSSMNLKNKWNAIGILRDNTSRKKAEEDLIDSRQRLELAIRAIDAGLWDWNIAIGEVIFNERWATMLGYTLQEIEGDASIWKKLMHPDDSAEVMAALNSHMEGKTPIFQTEHRLLTKSGNWKWVLDNGKVVERDDEGNPVRVIGTHIDIDKRKQAELELEEYRERLEKMVDERTRELEEAQKELLNKAMESGRAQMSAMVLHNIGNAVTPMKVQIEAMKSDDLKEGSQYLAKCYQDLLEHVGELQYVNEDPRGKEIFSYMGKLIEALDEQRNHEQDVVVKMDGALSYISEILTLQQAYAANEQETKERTTLNALMEDAIRMQAGTLEKRGILIKKDLAPDLPKLLIEKNRLLQVIVNFIKNSYEAIDELNDDNKDKVISFRSFANDGQIGFEITDSGIGIEQEEISNIFEFGKSSKGSSGFGLTYCRMFVEANKGAMEISSPGKGKGATVRVEFDLRVNIELGG